MVGMTHPRCCQWADCKDPVSYTHLTSLIGSAVLCAVLMLIGLVGCHSLLELCLLYTSAMIDSLSEEELFKPHMRKWADEATKTAVWEVYKFIHVNTVAPFGTFRTKIRKWKKVAL